MKGNSRASKRRLKKVEKLDTLPKKRTCDQKDSTSLVGNDNDNKVSNLSTQISPIEKNEDESIKSSPYLKFNLSSLLGLDDVYENEVTSRSKLIFNNLLYPNNYERFFSESFEKFPLAINRENRMHFDGLINKTDFLYMLKQNCLYYTNDISVSKYSKGSLLTRNHSPSFILEKITSDNSSELVQAKESDLMLYYSDGFCLRVMTPQKYHDALWNYLAALEGFFQYGLSCNATVAPLDAQEFPLKYEIADLYILQIDGVSQWSIFKPLSGNSLPISYSYEILEETMKEIESSPPVVLAVLHPGDMLYIPRGWVYKYMAVLDSSCDSTNSNSNSNSTAKNTNRTKGAALYGSSFHLTIFPTSTRTLSSLLDTVFPVALASCTQTITDYRKSLPRDFLSSHGVARSEEDFSSNARQIFRNQLRANLLKFVDEVVDHIDAAADQMAKQVLTERLPIPLTSLEEALTGYSHESVSEANVQMYTYLRMLRPGVARAVVEDGQVVVYHCMDNSRELFASPLSPLEFELDDGPAIEALLEAYPTPVLVSDLPHASEDDEDKVAIARALFKEGFLVISDATSQPVQENENSSDNNEGDEQDDDSPF